MGSGKSGWCKCDMKLLLNFKFGLNGEHEVITHFIVLTEKSIHEKSTMRKKKDWHHH